jgi:RNA polymerase sigma factor (sigma-70 family)
MDGLSDTQLVERYCANQEEEAFAALVRRHGGLVLGVCRRVLGHAEDTEDAFQATFLVLAQKAASIRKRESVGSWLYGVAYRIAMEVRLKARRRQTHERQAHEMAPSASLAEAIWPDLQPILDEELHRLPEKYRVPLVLCYLQGKSNRQAANELGWPTGSISRRLARGRELLRQNLARRGVVVPAALLAAALTEQATAATVSLSLLNGTVAAGLRFAAGKTVAGIASARALALAQGVLKAMILTKLKIATLFLLTVGMIALAVLTHQAVAQNTSAASAGGPSARKETAKPSLPAAKKAKVGPAEPKAERRADNRDKMTITGLVLDSAGKPAANAVVTVVGRAKSRDRIQQYGSKPKTLGNGKTGADGRFRLIGQRTSKENYWDVHVLAGGAGHGLGVQSIDPDAAQPDVKIRLPKEDVIRVRLFDLQGKPAAGVKVHVVKAYGHAEPSEAKSYFWLDFSDAPDDLAVWPKPATSDDKGRFSLHGIGRYTTVKIQFRSEHFARQDLEILSKGRTGKKAITMSLAPARILHGTVTYADTHKPLARARLLVHARKSLYELNPWQEPLRTTADEKGRFRIIPGVGNHFTVIAYPPDETPYLLQRKEIDWPKADVIQHEVNLALPRGVLVRGTITEEPSGKPVVGAGVEFEPVQGNNPFYRDDTRPFHEGWREVHLSGQGGKFHITVLPGPGHLLIKAPTQDYVRVEITNKKLYGIPIIPDARNYLDGLVALNLKPQPEAHKLKVTLKRGVTIKGGLVGPDGKPAAHAVLFSRVYLPHGRTLNGMSTKEVKDGRFELSGCDPEKTVQIFFFDAKNKLATIADVAVKKALAKPLTVRLQRCGMASARFVDKAGKPVAGVRPMLEVVVTPGIPWVDTTFDSKQPSADTFNMSNLDARWHGNLRSDAQGRITFPPLIPGATHWMIGHSPNMGLYNLNKEFKVEAGKTLDLGDIRVKTPE